MPPGTVGRRSAGARAGRPSMKKTVIVWFLALLLAGCGEDGADKPYVEFAGGGFIFNYNLAEAYYGFVARALRPIPEGTVLEAAFENPGGGVPLVVRQTAVAGRAEYVFRTPGIQGVEAGRAYQVTLRLLNPETGKLVASYSKDFRSTADQTILPKVPTTIGPGYQLNPESELLNPPADRSD
jgi:hypothetical protein